MAATALVFTLVASLTASMPLTKCPVLYSRAAELAQSSFHYVQVVEAFNTQFRLRLVAALKKEFKRLTGGSEGVTSISTAKLGEEDGMARAITEGAADGGRAGRKSEKVQLTHFLTENCPCLASLPLGTCVASSWVAGTVQGLARSWHLCMLISVRAVKVSNWPAF